jgi:hypothetical protein
VNATTDQHTAVFRALGERLERWELMFKMKYPENPSPNGRFTHESSRQADSMVTVEREVE